MLVFFSGRALNLTICLCAISSSCPFRSQILKQLNLACQNEDGSDDSKKGTQLLEVYALEIQMYTATKNNKRLKELYKLSLHIKSAIPHPKIMGIIRECGGKMHMSEGNGPFSPLSGRLLVSPHRRCTCHFSAQWEKAHEDFFEAFKNYDEAGSPRRIQCLK